MCSLLLMSVHHSRFIRVVREEGAPVGGFDVSWSDHMRGGTGREVQDFVVVVLAGHL